MQSHAAIHCPPQHGEGNHFRPVVHDDGLRIAPQGSDRIKHPRHSLTGEGEVGLEREVLARAVVTNSENTEAAVCAQPIVDKIERPPLVRREGDAVDRAAA